MRPVLAILAAGALTTWLLVGPFGHLLGPFYPDHPPDLAALIVRSMTTPLTILSLLATGLGIAAWKWRGRLEFVGRNDLVQRLGQLAANDYGFTTLNAWAQRAVLRLADALRTTQTGNLSWNVAGIVAALAIMLLVLLLLAGGVS